MKDYALGILAMAGVLAAGTIGYDDEVQAEARYCEMIILYHTTGGDYGWPDYRAGEVACQD